MDVATAAPHAPVPFCELAPTERPPHPSDNNVVARGVIGVRKKRRRLAGNAIHDFAMIEDRNLVMTCLSGGADSDTMLDTPM